MHAMVVARDGEQVAQVMRKAPLEASAADLGAAVAEALLARGAQELLQATSSN